MEADPTTQHGVGVSERRFRAMGTSCHVLITGPDGAALARRAQHRIEELERRWSRFLPDSEITRLNTAGRLTVSHETSLLIQRCELASQATNGIWNPLMGRRIAELGYDRTFATDLLGHHELALAAAPRISAMNIDEERRTVQLPEHAWLDLGGIAKGFAADLVSGEAMDAGAWGALINVGGDLRVRGLPPTGLDWQIEIAGATDDRPATSIIALAEGAVATSTTARRRWTGPAGDRHHLLDPRTSLPATTRVEVTSVIAGEAWWAEVVATALTIDPTLGLPGVAALQQGHDGSMTRVNDFEDYERPQR